MKRSDATNLSPGPGRLTATLVLLLAGAAATMGLWASGRAADQLRFEWARLSGNGWTMEGLVVTLRPQADGDLRLHARAERLRLPGRPSPLDGIELACTEVALTTHRLHCHGGEASLALPQLDRSNFAVAFEYTFEPQHLQLQFGNLALAGGSAEGLLDWRPGNWRVDLQRAELELASLRQLLAPLDLWPEAYSATGHAVAAGMLRGRGDTVTEATVSVNAAALAFSSTDGLNAAERLAFETRLTWRPGEQGFEVEGILNAAGGTLCIEACWSLPEEGVALEGRARWSQDPRQLSIQMLRFEHRATLSGRLQGRVGFDGAKATWHELSLYTEPAPLESVYRQWLQPLLIGTALDGAHVAGRAGLSLSYADHDIQNVEARLEGVEVTDVRDRFRLRGLEGTLRWSRGAGSIGSRLGWAGGGIYGISVGAGSMSLQSHAGTLSLAAPLRLPVLDGTLEVQALDLNLAKPAAPEWTFDGILTPVSMEAFTRAVGWPEMAGKLSGVIPDVQYRDQRLTVGGVLLVRVFDGNITIRDLELQQLLGIIPSLRANVRADNLDLELLTRTFSFGRIRGRLDARVQGLLMQNWRPVTFDAMLATPEDDDSEHRISQRAVDNLTRLGGGAGGALSRSFLRVFEEFRYQRLGLQCRLENGVCQMGGVSEAERGYYIVKGGGLPRIDVIGYERRVDWDVLVERLERVTRGGGPVVN